MLSQALDGLGAVRSPRREEGILAMAYLLQVQQARGAQKVVSQVRGAYAGQ